MTRHLPRRALVIWALLVTVTIVSWLVGTGHGLGAHAAAVVVLVLATAKAALIADEFPELRTGPARLRLAVLAEIALGGTALVVLYLLAAD